MREARNPLIITVGEKLVGLNLGADFCAEHEWGIKGIRRQFGINYELTKRNKGVDRHLVTEIPDSFMRGGFTKEKRDWIALTSYNRRWSEESFPMSSAKELVNDWKIKSIERSIAEWKQSEVDPYPPAPILSKWDESDFMIVVEKKNKYILDEIQKAMEENDCLIFLGGGGVFQNAGLTFMIKSRMPKEAIDNFLTKDETQLLVKKYDAKQERLKNKLKKAGKQWIALSPKLASERNMTTKYPIVYWLNPMDQRNNRSAWVTVEDLKDWLKDEGKIPMKPVS
jgi:hypothetical protein